MKWVKRFAAGMLAAALSLALLCGCSDSTKLDNVKELEYKDSILYTRTSWNNACTGMGWAMECTKRSNGQTIIMAEKSQQRIYIGTKLKGVVRGIENYYSLNGNYNTPAGTYQVDRKAGTYKKIEKLDAVDQVISDLFLSFGGSSTSNPACAPTKMEEASAARNGETYYVERAEYASGTAVVYYRMEGPNDIDAEAKYLDIYLPGQKTPRARFEVVKEEAYGLFGGSRLTNEYPDAMKTLTEVE